MDRLARLERTLERGGRLTGRELARVLEVSPATVSRTVRAAGDRVCRMGRRRNATYALRRRVGDLPYRIPIARVGADGAIEPAGELSPLVDGSHFVDDGTGVGVHYEGTPPFLFDMRPQGYLGAAFARWHEDLGLPSRLQDWNVDHEILALAYRGEDMIGNLVIGDASLQRLWQQRRVGPEPVGDDAYPDMARHVADRVRGSSAGGEGPKFLVYSATRDAHVLVKFTTGAGDAADTRWSDLLAAEAIALETLSDYGVAVPPARIVDREGRRFLELVRFDRVGVHGRHGLLSLAALDAEFVGHGRDWSRVAAALADDKMIDARDAECVAWLDLFGELIGNTDRHLGNVSFYARDAARAQGLLLAPAYDMLPMGLAPTEGGALTSDFAPRPPRTAELTRWASAADAAADFWSRVAHSSAVSAPFREIAHSAGEALSALDAQVRPTVGDT